MNNLFLIICPLLVVLIIVHAILSRRKEDPGHWTYSASLLISFLLLLIYSTGVGWLFYSDISWPHVGSLSIVFLMLLFPGIAFQSFFLAYSLIKRKLPAKRVWARLLSIVLGIILTVQTMNISQVVAMERFEESLSASAGTDPGEAPSPLQSGNSRH